MRNPLFADDLLGALDGHPVFVQELFDPADKLHVGGAIVTAAARAFHRLDLCELAFPETQDMRLKVKPVRDLANGAKCIGGLAHLSVPSSGFVTVGNTIFH